jgi:hypothetical protein
MLNRFVPILTCAAWLAAGAAMAQAPSAPIDVQAHSFIESYAAYTTKLEQIPRWHDAICVEVTGLPAASTAPIKARVEEVAKAVGVNLLPAGCKSNVEIMFTSEPQRLMDNIAAKQEIFLGYEHRDVHTKQVTHPVQAWYVTQTLGGAGPNAGAMFAPGSAASSGMGLPVQTQERVVDDPVNLPPTGCGGSRLSSCLQSVFGNVIVVVDTKRAGSKGLGPLSDYVAMLVLSEPRQYDRCNVLPSITDMFADGCGRAVPDGLTPADAAYLTALYAADPENRRTAEISDITERMTKILANGKVAAN